LTDTESQLKTRGKGGTRKGSLFLTQIISVIYSGLLSGSALLNE